jgi:hypothetical protein
MPLNYILGNRILGIRLLDRHLEELEILKIGGLVGFIKGMKFAKRSHIEELFFKFPFTELTNEIICAIADVMENYSCSLKSVKFEPFRLVHYECTKITKETWFILGEAIRSCTQLTTFILPIRGTQARHMDPCLRMLYGMTKLVVSVGRGDWDGLSGEIYRYANWEWTKYVKVILAILHVKKYKPASFLLPMDLIRKLTEYLVNPHTPL